MEGDALMAVRYTLQAEIYGTAQTLNRLQTDAESALGTVQTTGDVEIRQQTFRGKTELLVEVDSFVSRADGDSIMDSIIARCQQRGAAVGSYVRLSQVDDVALTIIRRYAEATAWTVAVTGPDPL